MPPRSPIGCGWPARRSSGPRPHGWPAVGPGRGPDRRPRRPGKGGRRSGHCTSGAVSACWAAL
eukprot:14281521-Alexandrium_andersonii.AAC.1